MGVYDVLKGGVAMLVAVFGVACGGSASEPQAANTAASSFDVQPVTEAGPAHVPASIQPCYECHQEVVEQYLDHGMARSIGPVGTPEPGVVTNPYSGNRYEIYLDSAGAWLKGTNKAGGTRLQRLVGRVGAGLFDTSWIGAEVNPFTNEETGRLFFAPVETIVEHGLELSPFELRDGSAGLDLGLSEACLTCHTTDRLTDLPKASVSPDRRVIYPDNALGNDAFEVLQPLGCEACHGDTRRHVTMMSGLPSAGGEDLGLESLRQSPAPRQRDVCARCHLQGDARFDLVEGRPNGGTPLAGQIPVLVPAHTDDDFRFVGQIERLVLSECFKASPAMTCTTCHEAHSGVAQQGTARFDAACIACHTEVTPAHTTLTVEAVTGEPARTTDGCVDCHVRRSQPFDLPHIRTVDHNIRRRIPKPVKAIPQRQFADPRGPVVLFDDGRLAEQLATPDGQRWQQGIIGMGLVTMGRLDEAGTYFSSFPAPGTEAALQPTAPSGLVPLEIGAPFHHARGIALRANGQPEAALAAFSDALQLDPYYAGARIDRARLRILAGDFQGALKDTDFILEAHPSAEKPWNLRTTMALQTGHVGMAASALEVSTRHWPSDAVAWQQLALLYRQLGQEAKAQEALARARQLQPALPDLDQTMPPPGR